MKYYDFRNTQLWPKKYIFDFHVEEKKTVKEIEGWRDVLTV